MLVASKGQQLPDGVSPALATALATSPIIIELCGEPRGKGRPRFVRATGHAFTPVETRNYEAALRITGQQAMQGEMILLGPLTVDIRADFAVPASWSNKKRAQALAGTIRPMAKPDADNLTKMLDALNGVVWGDDKQIVELTIRKFYSARPRLKIEVEPI